MFHFGKISNSLFLICRWTELFLFSTSHLWPEVRTLSHHYTPITDSDFIRIYNCSNGKLPSICFTMKLGAVLLLLIFTITTKSFASQSNERENRAKQAFALIHCDAEAKNSKEYLSCKNCFQEVTNFNSEKGLNDAKECIRLYLPKVQVWSIFLSTTLV